MELFPGEPPAGPWRVEPVAAVLARRRPVGGRPVVAVDGRGAGGKTTCARRLAAAVPGAVVVHSDDVAWHHSFFGWADLLRDGILTPYRSGRPVAYTPPAWPARARPGAIEVPGDCPLLVVEGVGVSRAELTGEYALRLWVQSDRGEARRRGLVRDGGPGHEPFWDEWEAEEAPFLAADRPWERADLVVAGTPDRPYGPAEVVVAEPPGRMVG